MPDCTSRQCGLDPICKTPCGPGCSASEVCSSQGKCETAVTGFAVAAGGTKPDRGLGLVLDPSGNIFLAGYFQGQATFGSSSLATQGTEDLFLSKISPAGAFNWTVAAGGPQYDEGASVAIDGSGNLFLTGFFYETASFGTKTLTSKGYRDVFVAKMLPSGTFAWAVSAGGTESDKAYAIALDQNGNPHIIGSFGSQCEFGATKLTSKGKYDVFVAKVSSSGTFEWANSGGSAGDDLGFSLAVDTAGHVYTTGFFAGQASFGNASPITKQSAGDDDVFVARLDAAGSFEWVSTAGGSSADRAYHLALDGSGNAYVTGYFEGQMQVGSTSLASKGDRDAFVTKILPAGTFDWAMSAGGAGFDMAQAIAVDQSGSSYIAGHYEGLSDFGPSTGGRNVFVAKVTSSGKLDKVVSAGGAGWKEATDIALDSAGAVYVTGAFEDAGIFEGTSLSSSSSSDDVFLWKVPLK